MTSSDIARSDLAHRQLKSLHHVRTPRRKSSVWAYFEKLEFNPGVAKCLLCGKNFHRSNNTSNLLKHLKSIHLTEYQLITADKDAQAAALVLLSSTVKKVRGVSAAKGQYTSDSNRKKKLDEALIEMMALDMQPVSVIKDRGFIKFIHLMDPKYNLPTSSEISNTLLPAKYNEVKEKLRATMLEVQNVAISIEVWSLRLSEQYLCLTAHYVTDDWQMRSCLLEVVHVLDSKQTSPSNIATEIYKIMCEWKLENKVTLVINDNSTEMQLMMEPLGWNYIPCFGSMLNFIVSDCLGRDEELLLLQKKCNEIGLLFHTNIDAAEKLMNTQKKLNIPCNKILRDVTLHWNSTYRMFERISEQVEAINFVVCSLSAPTLGLTKSDQQTLTEVIQLLKPFQHAIVDLTMEMHVSLSKVIPLVKLLVYATSNCESSLALKMLLLTELQKSFGQIEENEFMAFATLLDPRFKKMGFHSMELSEQAAQLLITKIPSENMFAMACAGENTEEGKQDTSSLWKIFDQQVEAASEDRDYVVEFEDEFRKFSEVKLISRTNDPLMWWKQNGYAMPALSSLAKKYLGCPATATPCKRLFTKEGSRFAKKINTLKQKTSGMFLFLNANLDLV